MQSHHHGIERTDNHVLTGCEVGRLLTILIHKDSISSGSGNKSTGNELGLNDSNRNRLLLFLLLCFLGLLLLFLLLLSLLSLSLLLLGSFYFLLLLFLNKVLGLLNGTYSHTLGGLAEILGNELVNGSTTVTLFVLLEISVKVILIQETELTLAVDEGRDGILTGILALGSLEDRSILYRSTLW